MLIVWLLRGLFVLMGIISPALAHAKTITTSVRSWHGKPCQAYLHIADEAEAPLLAFSQQGTGIYTTGDEATLEPAFKTLVARGQIAVLTIDKPGIALAPEKPSKLTVVDNLYNRHTQSDLVICALKALEWARASIPLKAGLYLSGHSEGAQVMTRLYRLMLRRHHPLAATVRLVILSGLPMGDWRQMLDKQLPSRSRQVFWSGYGQRNDKVLRTFGGLAFTYLHGVFAQEPLDSTLESISALGAQAKFLVFQGLQDHNTVAEPVQAFEQANTTKRALGFPALNLKARYYDAGHSLNHAATSDIQKDIEDDLAAML